MCQKEIKLKLNFLAASSKKMPSYPTISFDSIKRTFLSVCVLIDHGVKSHFTFKRYESRSLWSPGTNFLVNTLRFSVNGRRADFLFLNLARARARAYNIPLRSCSSRICMCIIRVACKDTRHRDGHAYAEFGIDVSKMKGVGGRRIKREKWFVNDSSLSSSRCFAEQITRLSLNNDRNQNYTRLSRACKSVATQLNKRTSYFRQTLSASSKIIPIGKA